MAKWYAIKIGYDKKNEIEITDYHTDSWQIASAYVTGINKKSHGVSPEYKSFKTEQEALDYLSEGTGYLVKGKDVLPLNALHCYIDGSFSEPLQNYSYGFVAVQETPILNADKTEVEIWDGCRITTPTVIHHENGVGNNKDAVSMQQVGGEMLGAMKALLFAKKNGLKRVIIFFDYKGIALHALGGWKRSTIFSKVYYDWMQKFFQENSDMQIHFCKVDAHTGDDFNEIADGLAKLALGIKPDNIFYRLVEKYELKIA